MCCSVRLEGETAMPGYYSVVQYLPDPVTDERVNIGVITYGDGGIRCRFLRTWTRVRMFGGEDVSFLREFAAGVTQATAD
jgi:Protein of unknown function (DUF3037)